MLDSGREVSFKAKDYEHIDHGYAVTVHKAQGVTVDRAYVLATPGMDRSLAYVGMTRHRESATMYAGGDDFANYEKLARNLSRERPKETTLDFAQRHGLDVDGATSRDAATQTNSGPAEKPDTAAKPAAKIDLSALDDRTGKPTTDAAAVSKPSAQQLRMLEGLKAKAEARAEADEQPATAKERQQAALQKRLEAAAERKGQTTQSAPDARMQEAVRLAVEAQRKAAEKAGKPFSDEAAKLIEQKTAERLQRDPKAVEQIHRLYGANAQGQAEGAGNAAKAKTGEQAKAADQAQPAKPAAEAAQDKGQAWFQRLREQRDAGTAARTKDQEKGGPER
jgi:hypothetical protein